MPQNHPLDFPKSHNTNEPRMILDNLYASEIRFSIVTEWDAGYRVRPGSEYGGFAATATVNTFAAAFG